MKARKSILFRALAVGVGLLPLVLVEIGLRAFHAGGGAPDALSGFNRNFPLFERHGAVYRTARSREPFFCEQEFAVEKPKNEFRFFCFGGSTVHGHPYQWQTAFPKWLEMELGAIDPARKFKSVNCGGVSYASYRLAPIVREVLEYQPDLVVVATGENEFLEDRTYQSLKGRSGFVAWAQDAAYSLRIVNVVRGWVYARKKGGVDARPSQQDLQQEVQPKLDEESGYASYHRDDDWHAQVLAQFEDSIRGMIRDCRKAGVPIVLLKLGSNLRDCPPFKSEHRLGLSAAQESEWVNAFDAGTKAEDKHANKEDPPGLTKALEFYRKAEALDREYALLDYRIARVCDRLGQKGEAKQYFERARDQDICPLRLPGVHAAALEKISADTKTPLVDVARVLAAKCPDAIPGNDTYLDHVHPTIRGHQLMAQAIAGKLQEMGIISAKGSWSEKSRRSAYEQQLSGLGEVYFSDGRRRVGWLDHWARRNNLYEETIPRDGAGWMRMGLKRLELGEEDEAWDAFRKGLKLDGKLAEVMKEYSEALLAEGRSTVSSNLIEDLKEPRPLPTQVSGHTSRSRE